MVMSAFASFVTAEAADITLDDGTQIQTAADGTLYAEIPAGHPRIPMVECAGAEILQAAIPEDETEGWASVTVDGVETLIKFVKTETEGFELQYDDHYTHDFGLSGDVTITSSNDEIIAVEDGVLVVKAVTDEDVTITASNGTDTKTLTVSETSKAVINIALVIGQSNSEGAQGDSSLSINPKAGVGYNFCAKLHGAEAEAAEQAIIDNYRADWDNCATIAQNCTYLYKLSDEENKNFYQNNGRNITYADAEEEHADMLIDMSEGWKGFANAYAKEYYEKTGEKTLAVQAGVGGSAMSAWYPDYNDGKLNAFHYEKMKERYAVALETLGTANYEIRQKGWFWIQGETDMLVYGGYTMLPTVDPECDTREVYKERLISLRDHLSEELGMEYGAIFVVRYTNNGTNVGSTANYHKDFSYLHPVRIAQFEAALENADLYIASDLAEHIPNTMTDNGFHYNQEGYNNIGTDAADNMSRRNSATEDTEIKDIAVYLDFSHVRADDNGVLRIDPLRGRLPGTNKTAIAFALYPTYAEAASIELVYDKASGLVIEDGTITVTDDFTQTELTVVADGFEKTYIVENVNYQKELEARYDENENLIYVNGKIGNMAGSQVGISLVDNEGNIAYIDQAEVDESYCINHLIQFEGDIDNYTVNITVADVNYINAEVIELKIAKSLDRLDVSADVVLNTATDAKDENTDDDHYTYSVTYTLTSAFKTEISGTAICAYYDKDGALIDVDSEAVVVDALDGATFTANVNFKANTVKVFVMDDYNGLIPLTNDTITILR